MNAGQRGEGRSALSRHWVSVVLTCIGHILQLEMCNEHRIKARLRHEKQIQKYICITVTTIIKCQLLCDMVRGLVQRPTKPRNPYSIIVYYYYYSIIWHATRLLCLSTNYK